MPRHFLQTLAFINQLQLWQNMTNSYERSFVCLFGSSGSYATADGADLMRAASPDAKPE
jgi:hypothetical protein